MVIEDTTYKYIEKMLWNIVPTHTSYSKAFL